MSSAPTPAPAYDRVERWLAASARGRRPVDERVQELIAAIRAGSERYQGEDWDTSNERHAEAFIAQLRAEFGERVFETARPPAPGDAPLDPALADFLYPSLEDGAARAAEAVEQATPVVIVERQHIPAMAQRTTAYNYAFTVPGESPERLILVAHYDTWRGPGADDNGTGEEIVKQYLLADLRAARPPKRTRVYLLAGSEECGLIGFTSQVFLAAGLSLANAALARGVWAVAALGLALVPLANFRFGVSGSREYVKSLSEGELRRIASVMSIDSVGEGRIYIPESSLGANFIRAFLPFSGYESLNDILEEGAHLHGIKYNNFIAGGTTDHVSFLEANSGWLDRLADVLGAPKWLGTHKRGRPRIPASALVALCPGKASPLVFGGKIHTPNDTPDRIYPQPLAESLRILDYWYHVMEGGDRVATPRQLDEYHYAQLYRVRLPGEDGGREEHWLALKDAIEPNRRNLNGLYRCAVRLSGARATCTHLESIDWGVHTRLRHEVAERLAEAGGLGYERVAVAELLIPQAALYFALPSRQSWRRLLSAAHTALGMCARFMGSNTFLTFFAAAYLLAQAVSLGLTFALTRLPLLAEWFFRYFVVTLPLVVLAQMAILLWLIGRKLPAIIDNHYRHLNKADNLVSLRRVYSGAATGGPHAAL